MTDIETEREIVTLQCTVTLSDSEILDIVEQYRYNNIKPIKRIIDSMIHKLSVGDLLLIARLCAVGGVIDYAEDHEVVNYELLRRLIDNNTSLIFGNKIHYHISTYEIVDLLRSCEM